MSELLSVTVGLRRGMDDLGLDWKDLLEWTSTLFSLIGFWYCIQKRAFSFLIFLGADVGWLLSGVWSHHHSLIVQQVVYVALNVTGYILWKRDEAIESQLANQENETIDQVMETLTNDLRLHIGVQNITRQ